MKSKFRNLLEEATKWHIKRFGFIQNRQKKIKD